MSKCSRCNDEELVCPDCRVRKVDEAREVARELLKRLVLIAGMTGVPSLDGQLAWEKKYPWLSPKEE